MQRLKRRYFRKTLLFKLISVTIFTILSGLNVAGAKISDENLLILEPVVQKYTFKDYAYAYEFGDKVYISLPQMSAYVGIKYKLNNKILHLTLVNEEQIPLNIDLQNLTFQRGSKAKETIAKNEVAVLEDTLFFSSDLWKKILDSNVEVNKLNMHLVVERDKDFPTISKLKAEEKRDKGVYTIQQDSFKNYEFDNRLFGAPVIDLSLGKGWRHSADAHTSYNSDSYSMNIAMLALGLDTQAYIYGDSNSNNRKPRVRLSGSRTFLEEPANKFNLKTLKMGDLTGLGSSYFASGNYGRGMAVSSFKNLVMSADKTIDITGPLQDGWQVELYWNNQLIGFRQYGTAGQYNFADIPVSYGLNTFKLVFYGPYGETYSETKRYYSGTSPVSKGEFGYNMSAYQPYRYLFEENEPFTYEGKNIPIADFVGYYGATDNLTLMGGYTQTPDAENNIDTQRFSLAGAQMAVMGSAVQYNLEQNLDTQKKGHHLEWQGDVYVGNVYLGYDKYNKIHSPKSYYNSEYLDNQIETRFSGILPYSIPYYLSYREGKLEESKDRFSNYSARISKQITNSVNWTLEDNYYNLDYQDASYNRIRNSIYTWKGKYTTQTWFDYETSPQHRITEFSSRVDWRSGRNTYISLQYRRDMMEDMDYVSLSGGQVYSFGGVTATLETDSDLNLGMYLTYNISFAKEPARNRLIKTGAAKLSYRGTIYAEVYDENGEPLEGVGLNANGLEKEVYTDEDGVAVLTDLQTYERTIVKVDKETLPDISLQPEEDYKKLVLNPGTVRTLKLPFVHRGAIEGKLANPENRRLFGYKISVLDEDNVNKGETFADIEGYFILDGVPYGTYKLLVEKEDEKAAEIENVLIDDSVIFLETEIEIPFAESELSDLMEDLQYEDEDLYLDWEDDAYLEDLYLDEEGDDAVYDETVYPDAKDNELYKDKLNFDDRCYQYHSGNFDDGEGKCLIVPAGNKAYVMR